MHTTGEISILDIHAKNKRTVYQMDNVFLLTRKQKNPVPLTSIPDALVLRLILP